MSLLNRCAPLSRFDPLRAALVFGLVACAAATALADDGLRWPTTGSSALDDASLQRWRGQFGVSLQDPGDAPAWDPSAGRPGNLSLLGGYYFSSRTLGASAGGFRATGGVIGARSPMWSGSLGTTLLAPGFSAERRSYSLSALAADAGDATALPYFGVGYTGLLGKRGLTGQGWGFSADLGLTALQPHSAVKLGQVGGGQQTLGEMVRDLRLNPMVNVGVSYAF